jgi:hypothetical protein
VLLSAVALLAVGAVAWGAASVTNVYVVSASVTPVKSGTRHHPKPIASALEWDVSTSPPGQRPATVKRYTISYQGIHENTTLFPACATSTLARANASASSCPRGSRIGSGFLIFELGATGFSNSGYNPTCTSSLALFNGGFHDLTLLIYEGKPAPGQPTECTLPGNHVAINVNLLRTRHGVKESFRMPIELLHPVPGFDTAVIRGVIRMKAKHRVVSRMGGVRVRRRVGLFQSFFCPASHQRRVAMTFFREDGSNQTTTSLVACS